MYVDTSISNLYFLRHLLTQQSFSCMRCCCRVFFFSIAQLENKHERTNVQHISHIGSTKSKLEADNKAQDIQNEFYAVHTRGRGQQKKMDYRDKINMIKLKYSVRQTFTVREIFNDCLEKVFWEIHFSHNSEELGSESSKTLQTGG